MCGRNSLSVSSNRLAEKYNADVNQSDFNGRYNIAPGDSHPIIRKGSIVLEDMTWNFVPEWADSYRTWKNKSVINSRLENVDENNLFRDSFEQRKCLIPSTGFYEWKNTPTRKQPYRIKPVNADIFSLAGIWSRYKNKNSEVHTFSILTMPSNQKMSDIHERMPVIIRNRDERKWINGDLDKTEIEKYSSNDMEISKVSEKINNPTYDSEDVLDLETNQNNLKGF